MLPKVKSMFGFWNSIPGRKFFLVGWTRNGVSMIYKHTHTHTRISISKEPQCCPYVTRSPSDKTLAKINKERQKTKMIQEAWEFTFNTLNSCRLASGSHTSFSMLPPATNKVVTIPISTQAKMKEKPTPLKVQERKHNHTETSVFFPLAVIFHLFTSCLPFWSI